MNPFTGCAVKKMLAPISINGTAATVTGVDCAGYKWAMIILGFGVIGAADFDAAGLAVLHADADTGYAVLSVDFDRQITTASVDTNSTVTAGSFQWTVTGTASDDGTQRAAFIDLSKCKRWLSLNIDPGAVDCLVSAYIVLMGGNQAPNTGTERGLKESITL